MRNQNSNVAWTDAGGRKAIVQGTIATDIVTGPGASLASIQFLGSSGTAVEDKLLRPDPALFNPNITSTANPNGTYTSTAAATAAYGGRVNANDLLLTSFTLSFLSLNEVGYSTTSAPILLGAPSAAIPAFSTTYALETDQFGSDGQTLNTLGTQVNIPDQLQSLNLTGLNSAASSITWLGGNQYKLTYNVNVPVVWNIHSAVSPLNGTLTGVVIATATIPEPSTFVLAAIGLMALGFARRRL